MSKIILDVTDCNARELVIVNNTVKSLSKAVASMKVVNDTNVSHKAINAAESVKHVEITTFSDVIDKNEIYEHFF